MQSRPRSRQLVGPEFGEQVIVRAAGDLGAAWMYFVAKGIVRAAAPQTMAFCRSARAAGRLCLSSSETRPQDGSWPPGCCEARTAELTLVNGVA